MPGFLRKTLQPKIKFPSELRFDLVSKDWVVIATGRAKRPEMFRLEKRIKPKLSEKDCPFCDFRSQANLILEKKNTVVVANKYPPFLPYPKLDGRRENDLYQTINAVGFCEVVITKDHKKHFANFNLAQAKEALDVYQERYLCLKDKPNVNYISIFHNHGVEAGASQPHPHSQIVTTPLIDVDLRQTLASSEKYFKEKKKCVYCQMNDWEKKTKKRIVFENEDFLVVCPFASKAAFEMIISSKNHLPYFERINEKEKWGLAQAFKAALAALYKGLKDPPYNFYLHTSPCDKKDYSFYHWHWTILPKTSTWAGFEIGTMMEISTIEPEKAAKYLRKQI